MSSSSATWKESFPYETAYRDHFETSCKAYDDIVPLLDELIQTSNRANVTIYDPYYCDGRAGQLLRQLGFQVQHQKRDFYEDIKDGKVPYHDILLTNPPFSDQHKKKCLEFCFEQLRGPAKRPFAILMPNYVAAREYYKKMLQKSPIEDVIYFIPSTTYHYDHPDGTGKDKPPFESLWFIGVNVQREWKKEWSGGRVVNSLEALSRSTPAFQRIFQKRPNPQQRRKKSKKRAAELKPSRLEKSDSKKSETKESTSAQPSKKSKYRDATGNRKRGRF